MKSATFWVVTLCSLEKVRRSGGTYRFQEQGRRVSQARTSLKQAVSRAVLAISCFAYSLTLQMDEICLSETLGFFLTTRCYYPEDCTLRKSFCCKYEKPRSGYPLSRQRFEPGILWILEKSYPLIQLEWLLTLLSHRKVKLAMSLTLVSDQE